MRLSYPELTYLFFINTVFIALATYCGVRLMHFHRHEFQSPERARRAHRYLMVVVVLTMLPAAYMTVRIVHQHIFDSNVRRFIKTELSQRGTQIISDDIDRDSLKLRIVAVGREITEAKRTEAERHMAQYGMEDYQLRIIQGTQSDSLLMLNDQLTHLNTSYELERKHLARLSAENAHLREQLSHYARMELLAAELRPEMAVLFPHVSRFSLSQAKEYGRDSADSRSYVAVIIQCSDGRHLSHQDAQKLNGWLKKRVKADSLVIVSRD